MYIKFSEMLREHKCDQLDELIVKCRGIADYVF